MRSLRLLAVSLLLVFPLASVSRADVTLGNLGSSGTGSIGTTGYTLNAGWSLGIPFTTGSAASDFTSVVVGLQSNTGFQTPTAFLYSNSGGQPFSSLGTLTSNSIAFLAPNTYSFNASTPISLDPSTTYWVVLGSQTHSLNWIKSSPDGLPTAQNGSGWSYPVNGAMVNDGDSWLATTSGDQGSLSANATLVPEPSTFALAAIAGLGGLAALRRRRKA